MVSRREKGLYDPRNEHARKNKRASCGVGLSQYQGPKVARHHQPRLGRSVNLDHRGAVGADPLMGDGAAA
jgi:glutamate synthase (NADPH/NADH) large chain